MLDSHDGAGFNVTWAHPKYSNVIATCGQDSKIKVWQESAQKKWEVIFEDEIDSAVNCIAFASWEYGLTLAAGSASGFLHLYSCNSLGDSPSWK